MKFKVNGAIVEIIDNGDADTAHFEAELNTAAAQVNTLVDENSKLCADISGLHSQLDKSFNDAARVINAEAELTKLTKLKDRLLRVENNLDRARDRNCRGCTIRHDRAEDLANLHCIAKAVLALEECYAAYRDTNYRQNTALGAWRRSIGTNAKPDFRNLCKFVREMLT